jgi:hypothetical protein
MQGMLDQRKTYIASAEVFRGKCSYQPVRGRYFRLSDGAPINVASLLQSCNFEAKEKRSRVNKATVLVPSLAPCAQTTRHNLC